MKSPYPWVIATMCILMIVDTELHRPQTPAWLGDASLLPYVPQDAVKLMRQVLAPAKQERPSFWTEKRRYKHAQDIRDISYLRDSAAKALIWIYAEDSPDESQLQPSRAQMLSMLLYDPSIPEWLLPVLRRRIAWAAEELAAGRIDHSAFTVAELSVIQTYFSFHGTDDDLEQVFCLQDALCAQTGRPLANQWANRHKPKDATHVERLRAARLDNELYRSVYPRPTFSQEAMEMAASGRHSELFNYDSDPDYYRGSF